MPPSSSSSSSVSLSTLRVVLPGDRVHEVNDDGLDREKEAHILLGPGLRRDDGGAGGDASAAASCVSVCRAGLLRRKTVTPAGQGQGQSTGRRLVSFWVDCHSRRYVAQKGENVIGVVTHKGGDSFRVDIGTSEPASLSYLAFEGATKKNRPNVQVGDVIYAKLLVASRDMEPELVCVDSYGKKAGLGVLGAPGPAAGGGQAAGGQAAGGSGPVAGASFVFNVPLHLVRKLLNPDCVLLSLLGKTISFEIAVGMNGRIWLRGKTPKETICLSNAIAVAEYMNNDEIRKMVNKLSDALAWS